MLLIAPGLFADAAGSPAPPALARLAHYSDPPQAGPDGLAHLVCALLGLGDNPPVAALVAAGAGLPAGSDYWLVADPVTLVAGRTDVVLSGPVESLSRDESAELLTALNAHFHDDGLAFVAARPNVWLARMSEAPALATTPLERARRGPLAQSLPGGDAGPRWRRWQDEIQMLLHAHPVNTERDARHVPPVNGVWMWGGGRLADAQPAAALAVDAPPTRLGDLARGIGLAARAGTPAGALRNVTVHAPLATPQARDAFVEDALGPALAALERGEIDVLDLAGDGAGAACVLHARPPSLVRRMTARWRPRPFATPKVPQE